MPLGEGQNDFCETNLSIAEVGKPERRSRGAGACRAFLHDNQWTQPFPRIVRKPENVSSFCGDAFGRSYPPPFGVLPAIKLGRRLSSGVK